MEKDFVYVAPQVEIIEVEVEKGFATSPYGSFESIYEDSEEGM